MFSTIPKRTDVALGPFAPSDIYFSLFHQSTSINFNTFSFITGTLTPYAVDALSTFAATDRYVSSLFYIFPLLISILIVVNTRWILPRLEIEERRVDTQSMFFELMRLNYQNGKELTNLNNLAISPLFIA